MDEIENIELFVIFDLANPMVMWEVAIGRLMSADEHNRNGYGVSLWMYRFLQGLPANGISQMLSSELVLERVHRKNFPNAVSRLQGVYGFEREDDARTAAHKWGLTDDDYVISKINFSATSISRHDSEWIHHREGFGSDEAWMQEYWRGESYDTQPLTEVLVTGIGVVVNNDMRNRSYRYILETWPYMSKILSFGSAAFYCGVENAARVFAGISSDGKISRGSYYIDMSVFKGDTDFDMNQCLKSCTEAGITLPYDPCCDDTADIHLADFCESFEVENASITEMIALLQYDRG